MNRDSFKKKITDLYDTVFEKVDEDDIDRLAQRFSGDELDLRKRLLCAIATLTTLGKTQHLRLFLEWAFIEDIPPEEMREVILQCYLFAGYPAAIEGFFILRDVLRNRGVSLEDEGVAYCVEEWRGRGLSLCQQVYGKNFNLLQKNMVEISPELAEWMIVEGYGKVLSRSRLKVVERELCTVASLTATGWERQLHSHIKGALNVGATESEVGEVIRQTSLFAGCHASQKGLELFNQCCA